MLKRDEATGKRRKLHSEEFHDLRSSPNFIRMIKSRIMRWAGRVARRGVCEKECIRGCGGGNLREGDILEDPCVGVKITLKWILRKSIGTAWTGLLWLTMGANGGFL